MKGKNIAGGFDKENKKGVPHFVKFKCAVFYLLDADCALGKTMDAAASIDFSMSRINFLSTKNEVGRPNDSCSWRRGWK